ncbi:MAG TPA: aldolase [Methylomirabilota bacterium]|jgi:DhnA family fructose-bisphosphate aldolase class Ia|nr:aldolase [Methylomirabilota bacterium]
MTEGFDPRAYLPRELYEAVTEIRVHEPAYAETQAGRRRRRSRLAPDGKLVILAVDHPGRNNLKIGDDPLAMADRHQYLARILRVLGHPGIDGVMSTPDLIEDLFVLGGLLRERGGANLLDDRVMLGCMNRGGLPGTAWEMDDRFTAFTVPRLQALGLDGAKFMLRLDPTDDRSLTTLEACARAVTELAAAGLTAFLEPLPVVREETGYRVRRTVRHLAGAVTVASALGASSLHTWLKLPTCPRFETVVGATSLPIVVLGGEAVAAAAPVLGDLRAAMQAGANVRGAMIGRNVVYPGGDDPRAMAAAVAAIIHDGADVPAAVAAMEAERGKDPRLLP